jgi:DUF2934 family protein
MAQPESAVETGSRRKRTVRRSPSADTPAMATSTAEPTARDRQREQDIRLRAYFLFLERNGQPGDPVADWLRAERESPMDQPEASE